jgi:hypothetical protein
MSADFFFGVREVPDAIPLRVLSLRLPMPSRAAKR